ncbi:MAG: hypothetical protein JSR46_09855, partial [Verrucomicrobia bacterium]|nr:hypothetical protein [Verrucomicrobiota bacterium]
MISEELNNSPTLTSESFYQPDPSPVRDRTGEFINLAKSPRTLALALLSRPMLNANKIAHILLPDASIESCPACTQCFELLIKLHYNLSAYFQGLHDDKITKIIEHVLVSRTSIQITDLLACGMDLSARERKGENSSSNFSFLIASLSKPRSFYETGQFEGYHPIPAPCHSEQLDKHTRDFISEADVTQFLQDLVFNCNLDLTIPLSTGTALSLFREIATALPPNNAFQEVLSA